MDQKRKLEELKKELLDTEYLDPRMKFIVEDGARFEDLIKSNNRLRMSIQRNHKAIGEVYDAKELCRLFSSETPEFLFQILQNQSKEIEKFKKDAPRAIQVDVEKQRMQLKRLREEVKNLKKSIVKDRRHLPEELNSYRREYEEQLKRLNQKRNRCMTDAVLYRPPGAKKLSVDSTLTGPKLVNVGAASSSRKQKKRNEKKNDQDHPGPFMSSIQSKSPNKDHFELSDESSNDCEIFPGRCQNVQTGANSLNKEVEGNDDDVSNDVDHDFNSGGDKYQSSNSDADKGEDSDEDDGRKHEKLLLFCEDIYETNNDGTVRVRTANKKRKLLH